LLLKGLHEPSKNIIYSPRQLAFAFDFFQPKFLNRGLTLSRQISEWINAKRIQVEKVARRFFSESDIPPQVWIYRMFHNEVAMLLEKGPDFGGEGIYCGRGGKKKKVKPPSFKGLRD